MAENENTNYEIGNEDTEEDELTIKNHQLKNKELNRVDSTKPIISFGVLSDIQYADVDDGDNYAKDKKRYYRNSVNLVKEAVKHWHVQANDINFKFVIQLGDLIDAKISHDRENAVNLLLNELKSNFETFIPDFSLYHCWGNHEFYCFKRDEIVNTELNSAKLLNPKVANKSNYYSIDLSENIKLICLDFYEISVLGYDENDDVYKDTLDMLKKHNTNEDLNSADGLRGHAKRFTKFNGSCGKQQMEWLEEKLKFYEANNHKVIVCGHLPVHPQACATAMCLAWNYKEVLDLFGKFEKTVLAYLCGHDHDGGYFRDKHNIHHLTFPGIIETPPNSNSFATIKVYDNKISIEGVGLISYYEVYY